MIPPAICEAAIAAGIRLIAVTDHNASDNVKAVSDACKDRLTVLGGMEITSEEEIHLLAICPDSKSLADLQAEIDEHLTGTNDPERFGEQYIVDHEGYIVDTNKRLLSGATDLGIDRLLEIVHEREGLAIACHVDRMSYSIVSQLGFIPDSFALDAVEISCMADASHYEDGRYRYPVITNSDAHEPDQIGLASTIYKRSGESDTDMDDLPGFDDLALAIRDADEGLIAIGS